MEYKLQHFLDHLCPVHCAKHFVNHPIFIDIIQDLPLFYGWKQHLND